MSTVSGGADLGRRAEDSDWLDRLAAAGLVAYGLVHLVLAWLSIQLAFGERSGSASTTGAIRQLAQQPFGKVLVWAVAVGMLLLVIWQGIEAAVGHREEDGAKRWGKRATSAGKAVVYAVLMVSAVKVAAGSGGSGGSGTDSTTAKLLDMPFGQVLVFVVGLAIIGVGVALVVRGWTEKFLKHLDAEGRSHEFSTAFRMLGKAGYIAKGVALGVVGSLFLYAAVSHDAKKSGGMDQALETVLRQPFGPVLLVLIGLGFAAFGVWSLVEARYLRR